MVTRRSLRRPTAALLALALLAAAGVAAAQAPGAAPPSPPAPAAPPAPPGPAAPPENPPAAAPDAPAADAAPPGSGATPAAPAGATPAPPGAPGATTPRVRFHHAPVAAAQEGAELVIEAGLDDPHLARAVTLIYRTADGALHEVPFRRSEDGYRSAIPAEHVHGKLAYAVEVVTTGGEVAPVFASRADFHPVQLLPDAAAERQALLLARLGGRRSVATVSSEYASFGSQGDVTDAFWRVEGRYTYRPLTTIAEFWIRGGVMRGTTPSTDEGAAGAPVESERGLNYGAPGVRFRLADAWHIELEGMASISDEGFSTGGGFDLLIGDPYGSKLVLGAAFIGLGEATYFGSTFSSRVDIAAHERVTLSPIIEITDMPNAEQFGVRLLADIGVDFGGGFSADLQGGYQARVAASGGPSIGGSASYAF